MNNNEQAMSAHDPCATPNATYLRPWRLLMPLIIDDAADVEVLVCDSCGAENSMEARHCSGCGGWIEEDDELGEEDDGEDGDDEATDEGDEDDSEAR